MIAKLLSVIALIWLHLHLFESIPYQRCLITSDCDQFCTSYGYNRSDCTTRVLRLSRFCECHDCDFVLCATYCTKNNLKFVGCSCFALPTIVSQGNFAGSQDVNQMLTNECYDNKFFCQCSK